MRMDCEVGHNFQMSLQGEPLGHLYNTIKVSMKDIKILMLRVGMMNNW